MYFGKKQDFDWTFTLVLCDCVFLLVSVPLAPWVGRLVHGLPSPPGPVHLAQALLHLAICFYFLRTFRCYSWRAFMSRTYAVFWLALAIAMGSACFAILRVWIFQLHGYGTWYWLATEPATALACLLAGRILCRFLIARVFNLIPIEWVAIVGWSSRVGRVLDGLQARMGKFYSFVGFYSMTGDPAGEPPPERGLTRGGNLDDLRAAANQKKITLMLVDEATVSIKELEQISDVCSRNFINLRVVAPGFEVLTSKLRVQMLAGVPVMGLQDLHHERMHNRLGKRLLDLFGGLVGLVLALPIVLVCGILIYCESPGPIFYRQRRMTRGREIFEIYKLRSMHLDAEKEGTGWTTENDSRRLRVGAFMRRYNLDELPQFWNVLKGDMSLVGPRPERPEFLEKFNQDLPHYNLRHTCKAGLTGWAAVNGLRGDTSLEERLEFDLFYIENWSFWLDLKTLFLTIFPSRHAY